MSEGVRIKCAEHRGKIERLYDFCMVGEAITVPFIITALFLVFLSGIRIAKLVSSSKKTIRLGEGRDEDTGK